MGFFADLADFVLKRLFTNVRKAVVKIVKREEEKAIKGKRK